MSWFKRIFDGRSRRARAAEGKGDWRRASALWSEIGDRRQAAAALVHLADRETTLRARLSAWHDALSLLPEDALDARAPIEIAISEDVLEDALNRGVGAAEEKRRLRRAAERFETQELPSKAAEAYRLLGRNDDRARCLELAGEVAALEALLSRTHAADAARDRVARLVRDYERELVHGARKEALRDLREARSLQENNQSLAEMLRGLEARLPEAGRVSLESRAGRRTFVGALPAIVGRADADIIVRGSSVSRRHASLDLVDGQLRLRDLDSRNGTLVRGVPVMGEIVLDGPTVLGLGDDVELSIKPLSPTSVEMEVLSGRDKGTVVIVGSGQLPVTGLAASLTFDEGWAVLTPEPNALMELGAHRCALPLYLLRGDQVRVDEATLEVTS